MKLIFSLNGSWIVTDLIESLFHFHEVLYMLGFWNMRARHFIPMLYLFVCHSGPKCMVMECLLYGYGMSSLWLWNAFSTVMECFLYVMECLLYGYGMPSLWLWNAFSMVMEHSQSILLLIRCSLLPHLQSGEW